MKTFVLLSVMLWGVCSSMKAQEVMPAQDEIAAKKEINQSNKIEWRVVLYGSSSDDEQF